MTTYENTIKALERAMGCGPGEVGEWYGTICKSHGHAYAMFGTHCEFAVSLAKSLVDASVLRES